MTTFKSPFNHQNFAAAIERAQWANQYANKGRSSRDKRNDLVETLETWKGIMVDSPVILLTLAFFVLAIVEIIISWKMYGELQAGILNTPNSFLSVFLGLMIVLIGAVVSHFIGKRLDRSLFELEVYNTMRKSQVEIPLQLAEEKVRLRTRKHLIIGLVMFVILVAGVLAISFRRVLLIGELTGGQFGWLQKLLPVIVVILEVFCGIYLGYLFSKLLLEAKVDRLHREFDKARDNCAYHTRMARECGEQATQSGEPVEYNRELRDAIYRWEHRCMDNDNYVDEIPAAKNVKVLVTDAGKPVQGVHLFGLLPGREFTNAIWTNDGGQAVLEWMADEDYLDSIMADNFSHSGPFRSSSQVRIDLNSPKTLSLAS